MTPRLPDALQHFDDVAGRLEGRRPVLFLDFDGTLSPIVERPENARLATGILEPLRELARRMPIAIVSGRDREDVQRRVGIEGIAYAGSHGHDVRTPEGRTLPPVFDEATFSELDDAEVELARATAPIDGARLERKRASLAVHWRSVPPDRVPDVEQVVREEADGRPLLALRHGRKVFELVPAVDWDKGRAVAWLLESLDLAEPGTFPVYLGDDVTDEDAFRAVEEKGLGILIGDAAERVGPSRSHATMRLADPDAVRAFLERLLAHYGV